MFYRKNTPRCFESSFELKKSLHILSKAIYNGISIQRSFETLTNVGRFDEADNTNSYEKCGI